MRWIPLRQGVRGIVAAHGPHGLVTLHAWYEESDPKRIYETEPHYPGRIKWMFFPMGATERVSEVWVRRPLIKHCVGPAIMVIQQPKFVL